MAKVPTKSNKYKVIKLNSMENARSVGGFSHFPKMKVKWDHQ